MTFAAVDVTLRVGAAATGTNRGPRADLPRGGPLPVTGASLGIFVMTAIAMVVLGTIVLLQSRSEAR